MVKASFLSHQNTFSRHSQTRPLFRGTQRRSGPGAEAGSRGGQPGQGPTRVDSPTRARRLRHDHEELNLNLASPFCTAWAQSSFFEPCRKDREKLCCLGKIVPKLVVLFGQTHSYTFDKGSNLSLYFCLNQFNPSPIRLGSSYIIHPNWRFNTVKTSDTQYEKTPFALSFHETRVFYYLVL